MKPYVKYMLLVLNIISLIKIFLKYLTWEKYIVTKLNLYSITIYILIL